MKMKLMFLGVLFVFFSLPTVSFAQDEREQKAVEEREAKKEKSREEVRKDYLKKHKKMQTKETRRRMKKSRREAKRRKQGKHPQPWWNRWFSRKNQTKRRKKPEKIIFQIQQALIFIQNISFKNEHLLEVLCYFRVAENMNPKGIKILLMLVFIASAIHAQTGEIFGKITSEEGDTLPTTFVSLFKDGVQINATYSDFNGDYFFSGLNAGKYDVTCESLNFKKKTVKGVIVITNQKVEVDFELSGNNENQLLGTVDIVIYRKPLIDKDKQAQVYTADEIENLAARDISEIAATSVDVITQDDGSGDINIRGQRKEGTQFIVDGIKINGKLSIPQNAIEQIEVISGGLPAMYGDNIGGVIVVTTKGVTAKPYGAIEGVTSKGIDGFDYNLLTASYSGSLL